MFPKSADRSFTTPSTIFRFLCTDPTGCNQTLPCSFFDIPCESVRKGTFPRSPIPPNKDLGAVRSQPVRQLVKLSGSSYEFAVNFVTGWKMPVERPSPWGTAGNQGVNYLSEFIGGWRL